MEMQVSIATIEKGMEVPQKIKNKSTIWPSNSNSGYLFFKMKTLTSMFIEAWFIIAKMWKQLKGSSTN